MLGVRLAAFATSGTRPGALAAGRWAERGPEAGNIPKQVALLGSSAKASLSSYLEHACPSFQAFAALAGPPSTTAAVLCRWITPHLTEVAAYNSRTRGKLPSSPRSQGKDAATEATLAPFPSRACSNRTSGLLSSYALAVYGMQAQDLGIRASAGEVEVLPRWDLHSRSALMLPAQL